ncbi:MAG: hypothetical protein JST86_00455 [Bacteroidetes bacterium]|nr:hypothetical protein [Bacteroidota bacterium]
MKVIITGIFFAGLLIVVGIDAAAQQNATNTCKVEIYLLNKKIKAFDSALKIAGSFYPKKEDLQDTPFIKDKEIISYTIEKRNKAKKRDHTYTIYLSHSISNKINSIRDISICCGLKFAIVINDSLIFGGYFWNPISSFTANAVTAYIHDDDIVLTDLFRSYNEDFRKNALLLDSMKKTGRLVIKRFLKEN